MSTISTRLALGVACAISLAACAEPDGPAGPTASQAEFARAGAPPSGVLIYALTSGNTLFVIDARQPNRVLRELPVVGLSSGERLTGIDFRPSDLNDDGTNRIGVLYGVTSSSRLYLIDPVTGAATMPVALSVPVSAEVAGFGFNPAADRMRIHGTDGQNLRINVDNGVTLVDGVLAYATGDANEGATPAIAALAYTNSDADPATPTALYAIDHELDVLAILNANLGILTTIGSLGVNATGAGGFDIVGAVGGTAYAIISTSASGKPSLYAIDLATGAAAPVGLIAQSRAEVVSMAIAP